MADLDGTRNQLPLLQHHKEKHFTAGEIVRDIIIGVSDGLTVPFALAAGLSGANASSSIVLTAGIAEVAAGAISMGLGGYGSRLICRAVEGYIMKLIYLKKCVSEKWGRYLAAKSEADQYKKELRREEEEIVLVPDTG